MNTALSSELEHTLRNFYEENPQYLHPFLWHERETLLSASATPAALEDNTFALFSEILAPRLGFDRSDAPQKRYYDYICQQIYYFFTRRKGYGAECFTADALRDMLITTTSVAIAQQTGLDAALVTAAVTLVVSTVLKVGIRAWCQYYADRHPEEQE